MRRLGLTLLLTIVTLFPTKSAGGHIPHELFDLRLPKKYAHLPDIKDAGKETEEETVIRKYKNQEVILYQVYIWKKVGDREKQSYKEIRIPRNPIKAQPMLIPPYFGPNLSEEPPDPYESYFNEVLLLEELFKLPNFGLPKSDTLGNPGLNLRKTIPRTRK